MKQPGPREIPPVADWLVASRPAWKKDGPQTLGVSLVALCNSDMPLTVRLNLSIPWIFMMSPWHTLAGYDSCTLGYHYRSPRGVQRGWWMDMQHWALVHNVHILYFKHNAGILKSKTIQNSMLKLSLCREMGKKWSQVAWTFLRSPPTPRWFCYPPPMMHFMMTTSECHQMSPKSDPTNVLLENVPTPPLAVLPGQSAEPNRPRPAERRSSRCWPLRCATFLRNTGNQRQSNGCALQISSIISYLFVPNILYIVVLCCISLFVFLSNYISIYYTIYFVSMPVLVLASIVPLRQSHGSKPQSMSNIQLHPACWQQIDG